MESVLARFDLGFDGGRFGRLGARRRGGTCWLSVYDTGVGIPAVDRNRVFDEFQRLGTESGTPGMGLGLSISYGLVQSFGGAIKGLNHPEGGAAFTVELVPAGLEVAA